MKELLRFLLTLLGAAAAIYAYLKLLLFLRERGIRPGRYDPSYEPSKVEIQTLFHGNTKDEDQM